jgi:hypothetical protein
MERLAGRNDPQLLKRCPFGVPGDRLWVREAWRTLAEFDKHPPRELVETCPLRYEADKACSARGFTEGFGRYRPPMFMPRWASRGLDEVVSVRVERLRDISEADARAEGIRAHTLAPDPTQGWMPSDEVYSWLDNPAPSQWSRYPRLAYGALWEAINGDGSWAANPWVWRVEFKVITP